MNISNTSDTYMDRYPYQIEPTSDIGLQRYIDLDSITPEHIKRRPDIMEIILMFQDYLNNGYKKIPNYIKTIDYTVKDICFSNTKHVSSRIEPFNHTISMVKDRENNSMDLENTTYIEEYDASRDISTYITDPDSLDNYIQKYDYDYVGSYYYNRFKYYKSIDEFIRVNTPKNIETPFSIFISTFDSYVTNNSDLNQQFVLASEASVISSYNGEYEINAYFCGKVDFENGFNYTGSYSIEEFFYPIHEGQVDIYNEDSDRTPLVGTYSNKSSALNLMTKGTDRFRVKIIGNGLLSTALTAFNSPNLPISIKLNFTNFSDFLAKLPTGDYPIMANEFTIIKAWQDPEIFYNEFNSENKYRIDDKRSSILEKIHRIAFNKDPEVIDFEYIQFVAEQLGYNIDIQQEDLENNQYYTTKQEKEQALRAVLRNLPEFYKIKCTKTGLESLLLSFGIVGKIIYLYTIGDERQAGYADFADARLFEGEDGDNMLDHTSAEALMESRMANPTLASTVISDWFPSPHFKVELDLLRQRVDLDGNKLGMQLITKAIKKTKPINTVFQGFYGHIISNFGYIFMHNPKLHMTAYARTNITNSCVQIDTWDSKCNDG